MKMIRARLPLCVQACLTLVCIVGVRNYAETGRHPTGLAESAYSWATSASLLLFGWVIVEAVAKMQRWKRIAFPILSLLMLLMTKLVTDCLLIRE